MLANGNNNLLIPCNYIGLIITPIDPNPFDPNFQPDHPPSAFFPNTVFEGRNSTPIPIHFLERNKPLPSQRKLPSLRPDDNLGTLCLHEGSICNGYIFTYILRVGGFNQPN